MNKREREREREREKQDYNSKVKKYYTLVAVSTGDQKTVGPSVEHPTHDHDIREFHSGICKRTFSISIM